MSRQVDVAAAVQRLGVLLDAGLAPMSAWRAIASADPSPTLSAVLEHATSSPELPAAVRAATDRASPGEREAWRTLAAAWRVADRSGAPLAPALDRLATVLRSLGQSERDVAVALAGPIASARVVMALPLVGVLFGLAIGADLASTLFTTPAGWACLLIGIGLIAVAGLWTRALLRTARESAPCPGLAADLLSVALAGGLGVPAARELVSAALTENGLAVSVEPLDPVLAFAASAGVPAGALLRAEADEARRTAAADAQRRAAVLSVRLMLPLGICLLPSFLALGVVPVMLSLVSASTLGL